jgi:hypothetical protein
METQRIYKLPEETFDFWGVLAGMIVLVFYTVLVVFVTFLIMQHKADKKYINMLLEQNPQLGIR